MNKADKDKVIAALEKAGAAKLDDGTYLDKDCSITMAITIMRGLEDAAPVCNHEWFQTGAMLSNEKRCIQCGEWGKLYTSPQAALKSELSAQAALARLPSEGKPIEALAPTEAALRDVVRQSEDLGLYDADFQIGAQEREAFDTWFDSTPHGEPSYQETFSAGYQAGRAGSKP